jgi:YfiH family protein
MRKVYTLEKIRPEWPAPACVHAFTTTRRGGVSAAPYDAFNLALHVGDDESRVLENRHRLQLGILDENKAAGHPHIGMAEPAWLEQVHGTRVVTLDDEAPSGPADAAVAFRPGLGCAVLTADCLPVLLCDRRGTRVGIAHAGWRGLAHGVVEATVGALNRAPGELLAWLGPAIAPAAYEVGDEVRAALVERDPAADSAFERNARGRWQADLYALARQQLASAGVTDVHGGEHCTYSEPERFYSFRREGRCGRMASLIWLE